MAKLTQTELVLKTLGRRKGGFTDAELRNATGIAFAETIRSKLVKDGYVVVVGSKKDKATNRTVKTWGIA